MNYEKFKRSSREVLARIAPYAAVGSLALFAASCGESKAPSAERPLNPEAQIFRSGETIEVAPDVPVTLDGWRITVQDKDLERFRDRVPYEELQMTIMEPGAEDVASIGTSSSSSVELIKGGQRITVSPTDLESYLVVERTLDDYVDDPNEPDGFRVVRKKYDVETYQLKPESYENRKPKGDQKYFAVEVKSEADIGQANLDDIGAMAERFSPFIIVPDIFIYHTDDEDQRGGVYSPDSHRVEFTSISFTDPLFEKEGETKAFHEISHALMQNRINYQEDQRPVLTMFDAYRKLVKAAGWGVPVPGFGLLGPPDEIENNPYFRIFDESHYTPELKKSISNYGHPYSSYNEMFASAMAIIHFFPNQFIANYNALKPKQKEPVRTIVQAVDAVLRSFALENPDKDVANLQPSLDAILEAVK